MTEDDVFEMANQRGTIKLMKMSKGYNWEIKMISKDGNVDKEHVEKMEQLNNDMIVRFGEKI